VHSYSELLPFKPKGGAIPFGNTQRVSYADLLAKRGPLVHSYAEPTSTLRRTGSAVFSTNFEPRRTEAARSGPDVHSYAPVTSTLKRQSSAVFGTSPAPRGIISSTSTVHSYQQVKPMLIRSASGTFPKAGRDDMRPKTASCDVHSYAAPTSTLKTSGVAAWAAPRPPSAPSAVHRTPKLVAKLRAAVRPQSPTEIEDMLGERESLPEAEQSAEATPQPQEVA